MAEKQGTSAATMRRWIQSTYLGTVPPTTVLSAWADQELREQVVRVTKLRTIHRNHMNELREQGGTSAVA